MASAPSNCAADGATNCVAVSAFSAAATSGLASKVLSGQTVAGVSGNVTLPSAANVRTSATFGVSGGTSGTLADCSTDGAISCVVPSSGTIKAAETANFTGWDIRKTRNSGGTVLTFGGLTSQGKSHCRNQARTGVFDYTTAPGITGLDFFDTIDDYNNNVVGLPGSIPAWTMLIGGSTVTVTNDYKCGGIYATGSTNTGNTGADATVAHDPDGNWQDLTPGIKPGGANSTNTANGCNATDKHCVYKELMSGLMVTEVSATTYTWSNAINYCDKLGEATGAVTSPIPVIGGTTYTDWRLPTQKELMQLYNAGIRGLNQTATMTTNFGNVTQYFWSASSVSYSTTYAWSVYLLNGVTTFDASTKTTAYLVVCVR